MSADVISPISAPDGLEKHSEKVLEVRDAEEHDVESQASDTERDVERRELTQEEIVHFGTELLLLCRHGGEVGKIRHLIESGTPVHFKKVNSEWTPLMLAAMKGHTEIVQEHLELGALPDTSETDDNQPGQQSSQPNNTALQWACFYGHERIVWLLLQYGYPTDPIDTSGNTLLHLASTGGHYEIMRTLLAEGASLKLKNYFGNTPLALATDPRCRELLQSLAKQTRCSETNRPFTANNKPYLCTSCNHLFAQESTVITEMRVAVDVNVVRKYRRCKKCTELVNNAQASLRAALKLDYPDPMDLLPVDLPILERTVKEAELNGVDVDLVAIGKDRLKKLEAECQLIGAIDQLQPLRPLKTSPVLSIVRKAIEAARAVDVAEAKLQNAQMIVDAAESEMLLNGHFLICSEIACGDDCFITSIRRLELALEKAKTFEVNQDLLQKAMLLQNKLMAEIRLRRAIPAYRQETAVSQPDATASEIKEEVFVAFDHARHLSILSVLQHVCDKYGTLLEFARANAADAGLVAKLEDEFGKLKIKLKEEIKLDEERKKAAEEEAARKAKKAAAKKAKKK